MDKLEGRDIDRISRQQARILSELQVLRPDKPFTMEEELIITEAVAHAERDKKKKLTPLQAVRLEREITSQGQKLQLKENPDSKEPAFRASLARQLGNYDTVIELLTAHEAQR